MLLFIFSILFFGVVWLFLCKFFKILDYIGKFLNLVFFILFGIVVVFVFICFMGGISYVLVSVDYSNSVLFKGFIDGYNILDVLVLLVFGIIIVIIIKKLGIINLNIIVKEILKLGMISIIVMGVIYILLVLMGMMSLGCFKVSENGGIVFV